MSHNREMQTAGRISVWAESHKPGGATRTHLVLAGAMWTVVGTVLLVIGTLWVSRFGGLAAAMGLMAASFVGMAKSGLVLDRAADKIACRIQNRGDGRCLGGFLSPKSWALVFFMMGGGRLLRGGIVSHEVVGLFYVAVGTALVLSSRRVWRAV